MALRTFQPYLDDVSSIRLVMEKRFDVDGAYNIRYEIIKKRIDKAHIKNTQENMKERIDI